MTILSDFEDIRDANGLISPNKGDTSGNGLLFTAEAMLILRENSVPIPHKWTQAVWACEIVVGLYGRTPYGKFYSHDQESQDDYIGLGLIAHLTNTGLAKDILDYGRESGSHWFCLLKKSCSYYYPTAMQSQWDWNAWFGRFPALITHLEWAAGETPNILRRIAWFIAVAFCGTSQDGWILTHLMVAVAGDRGFIERLACRIRLWRFRRSPYKGSMRAVYLAYFNWDHPTALHSQ